MFLRFYWGLCKVIDFFQFKTTNRTPLRDQICKYQSGVRAIHSTVTALLEATDTWAYNIDRGKINAVVFLDLKKAFDTVDHEILLSKLSNYGIYGNAHQWFKSYLENRTQMCSINGSLSQSCLLSCGVPQGTILGPLLFLLYINDLPNCLSIQIVSRGCTLMTPTLRTQVIM